MNCPLCHNMSPIIVGKPISSAKAVKFIRKDYKVVKCKKCDFYFVQPKIDLTVEEWAQLYGNEYFQDLNEWYKRQRLNDISMRLNRMDKIYNGESKINFLDLGCGEGLALVEAVQKNWKAFGNDISDNRIAEARQKNINFYLGDLFNVHYPDNFFDVVHMDSVLEHLVDPVGYLKELNRIMKINAVIYIGVPNENSLLDTFRQIVFNLTGKSKISAKLRPFETPYHISGFTKRAIEIIASLSGFNVSEIINFATHFEFQKYPMNSRGFWVHLLSLPLDIAAIPLKMEKYYAIYLKKD